MHWAQGRGMTDRIRKSLTGEEERSDGTVLNPPTQDWDSAEYVKWNRGRLGSKFCFLLS